MRKSLALLGSAAAFATVSPALAADLPSKKAAPVDYVKICSIGSFTGFVVPGSDTCLKVGGRVRTEFYYNERFTRADNVTRFRARGYISADAQTPTEYGTLVSRVRFYVQQTTGGTLASTTGTVNADGAYLDYAFVQMAGFTVGRYLSSWYDFAHSPISGNAVLYALGGSNGRGSDLQGNTAPVSAAYTYKFGDVAATIAVEDSTARQTGISVNAAAVATNPNAGARVPDIIGRLEFAQGWGSVALTGAAHQVSWLAPADSTWGYAGQLGGKINVPVLAKGDYVIATAAYAEGASSFTGLASNSFQNESVKAGTVSLTSSDVTVNGTKLVRSKTWSVSGGALHFWTPTVSQYVFASVGKVNQFGTANDGRVITLGTQVAWKPVKNLEIGAEAIYAKIDELGADKKKKLTAADSKDDWSGRIRVQRDF